MEQQKTSKTQRQPRSGDRYAESIVNIIIHVILIFVVFNLQSWLTFLTSAFSAVAWLFYISYVLTIVANFFYLFIDSPWFKSLFQLVLNVYSIIIFYSLLKIFPFNLNEANQDIARIVIYVIIFGTTIGAIVELSRLIKLIGNTGEGAHDA